MSKKSRKIKTQNIQVSSEPEEEIFIMSDAHRGVYKVTRDKIRDYEFNPKERVGNHFGKKLRKRRKRSKRKLAISVVKFKKH